MHNIKYFFSLTAILTLSLFFVSLSYSKESTNIIDNTLSKNEDNLTLITSLGNDFKLTTEDINNLSIINHNEEDITYNIILKAYNNQDAIYYSIDSNEPTKYIDEIIYEETINKYGTTGDHKYHELKINAPRDTHFKIEVIKKQTYTIDKIITKSLNVYKENSNYRYYGLNTNNYLTYNNKLYRIIGLIDNKVKLISEKDNDSMYNSYLEYLELDDYLKSFNNSEVTIENSINYDSWLNSLEPYWLKTPPEYLNVYLYDNNSGLIQTNRYYTYSNRTIINIEPNLLIINGNGTINNPYEVSYES